MVRTVVLGSSSIHSVPAYFVVGARRAFRLLKVALALYLAHVKFFHWVLHGDLSVTRLELSGHLADGLRVHCDVDAVFRVFSDGDRYLSLGARHNLIIVVNCLWLDHDPLVVPLQLYLISRTIQSYVQLDVLVENGKVLFAGLLYGSLNLLDGGLLRRRLQLRTRTDLVR